MREGDGGEGREGGTEGGTKGRREGGLITLHKLTLPVAHLPTKSFKRFYTRVCSRYTWSDGHI